MYQREIPSTQRRPAQHRIAHSPQQGQRIFQHPAQCRHHQFLRHHEPHRHPPQRSQETHSDRLTTLNASVNQSRTSISTKAPDDDITGEHTDRRPYGQYLPVSTIFVVNLRSDTRPRLTTLTTILTCGSGAASIRTIRQDRLTGY